MYVFLLYACTIICFWNRYNIEMNILKKLSFFGLIAKYVVCSVCRLKRANQTSKAKLQSCLTNRIKSFDSFRIYRSCKILSIHNCKLLTRKSLHVAAKNNKIFKTIWDGKKISKKKYLYEKCISAEQQQINEVFLSEKMEKNHTKNRN